MLNVSYQLVYFIIIKNIVKIAIINNYTNSKSLHDDGMKVVKFTNQLVISVIVDYLYQYTK